MNDETYPLSTIYFYLTKGCNLRCKHCWINPPFAKESSNNGALDFDTFKDIIEQAIPLGLTGVKLTGGEPLFHPRIIEILQHLRKKNLRLTMESNGALCTPEIAQAIAGSVKPFISISLDGTDAKTHENMRGIKGCFEDTLRGIKNLVDVGLKPQIIMSISRINKDQMEEMIRLGERVGAGSVKYNFVTPVKRGLKMAENGDLLELEEVLAFNDWIEKEAHLTTPLIICSNLPPAFKPLGKMYGSYGGAYNSCGIHQIIGVISNGSYALCGIGENIPELMFGNAKTDTLESVWKNSPTIVKIRKEIPSGLKGICGKCAMKWKCLGWCSAQTYFTTRDVLTAYSVCDEAYQKGLFPESRILKEHAVT